MSDFLNIILLNIILFKRIIDFPFSKINKIK